MEPSFTREPFTVDVTLVHDTECRVVMDYEPVPYDCLRVYTLTGGRAVSELWKLLAEVAPSMFDLPDEATFVQRLDDERTILASSPDAIGRLTLQPLLGRYLSVIPEADQHSADIRPRFKLRFFWSGPGAYGIICKDTVASTARYPHSPR